MGHRGKRRAWAGTWMVAAIAALTFLTWWLIEHGTRGAEIATVITVPLGVVAAAAALLALRPTKVRQRFKTPFTHSGQSEPEPVDWKEPDDQARGERNILSREAARSSYQGQDRIASISADAHDDIRSRRIGERASTILVGNIPREPLGFVARADLLTVLDAHSTSSHAPVVQAVIGMRGVGKTHLAAAYARAKQAEGWGMVAWINANDYLGIVTGLADAAIALNLSSAGLDREAAAKAVRRELEVNGVRRLIVFDDVADPEMLQPFLPSVGGTQVIVTSNLRAAANLGVGIPVDVFTEDEATKFLAERTGSADVKGAGDVAAELGYLPLALAQAAAVIADQHLSYGTYLDRLRRMPLSELLVPVEAGQYPRGVAAAILLSLQGIQAGDSTLLSGILITLMAVLSPAGVHRDLFYEAGQRGFLATPRGFFRKRLTELPPDKVDQALARLAGVSLLIFSANGFSVNAHPLVMRVIRDRLAAGNHPMSICEGASILLEELGESSIDWWYRDREAARNLVEQIMALSEHSGAFPANSSFSHRMLKLRQHAVWLLNELGDSASQAISIAEPLQAEYEQLRGAAHPETLRARNNLANSYRGAGRAAEALTLFEQNLAESERVLGPGHRDTIIARNNLAAVYGDAGRTNEEIVLYGQSLADMEKTQLHDPILTWRICANLGIAYVAAGRTAEAIALLEQTLANQQQMLGVNNPAAMLTRINLASAYAEAGRWDDVTPMYNQTIAYQDQVLGTDHPDTLITRSNLFMAVRELPEMVALLEKSLADQERVLGADRPSTITTRANLALGYLGAGRNADAVIVCKRALEDQERILGIDHPTTLHIRGILAMCYQAMGNFEVAISLFAQVLTDRERILGVNHPDTIATRNDLAYLLEAILTEIDERIQSNEPDDQFSDTDRANITAICEELRTAMEELTPPDGSDDQPSDT